MKHFIKIFIALFIPCSQAFATYDSCTQIKVDTKTKTYRCKDSSVSFAQASYTGVSSKKGNYNGLCGATAAANVFHAYCQNLFVEPTQIAPKYFDDYTPGIRPDTMESGLTSMFDNNAECPSGEWKYYYVTNRYDFIQSLNIETKKKNKYFKRKRDKNHGSERSPVIVLISKDNGSILHYVTVVDILGFSGGTNLDKCEVVYNDWGSQKSATCDDFSSYANQVDNTVMTKILPEYAHLVFERD